MLFIQIVGMAWTVLTTIQTFETRQSDEFYYRLVVNLPGFGKFDSETLYRFPQGGKDDVFRLKDETTSWWYNFILLIDAISLRPSS